MPGDDPRSLRAGRAPRFTVLVAAYNAEAVLGRAIASVCAQTSADWELIICDDGSEDHTADVALSFRDPRITVIGQENSGSGQARNAAARLARGEYLCILDADDEYEPNYLRSQSRKIDRCPGADIYSCNALIINDATGVCVPFRVRDSGDAGHVTLEDMFTGKKIFVSATVRRTSFEAVGGFDGDQYAEDLDLWLRMLRCGMVHAYNPDILVKYHITGQNKSANQHRQWANASEVIERYAADPGLSSRTRRIARRTARRYLAMSELGRRRAEGDLGGGSIGAVRTTAALSTWEKRAVGSAIALVVPQLYWRMVGVRRRVGRPRGPHNSK